MLTIANLSIRIAQTTLVDSVSLSILPGECHALVGESGSGKSLTALAILGLLPTAASITGNIRFGERELLGMPLNQLRKLRGNRIAMVFQEPMSALNPVLTVGEQVAEPLIIHRRMPRSAALARAAELFDQVGISDPRRRLRQFPHEFSGGMRQRVMIAMALACDPDLLIADEPTTALDVTIQEQILALLDTERRRRGMSLLFITHDLAVVARIAQRISVMYSGRIVEQAPTAALFASPAHPYTRGLLACSPRIDTPRTARLPVIAGDVPDPASRPTGCAFHPRCTLGRDDAQCRVQIPSHQEIAADHTAACWKTDSATPIRSRSA